MQVAFELRPETAHLRNRTNRAEGRAPCLSLSPKLMNRSWTIMTSKSEPPATIEVVRSSVSCSSQLVRLKDFSNPQFVRGRSFFVEGLWRLVQWAFVSSWIPGDAHRRWLLRAFGARVGRRVVLATRIRVTFPWRLEIGDYSWVGENVWIDNLDKVTIALNCCISQGAYLCTGSHDWSRPTFDLITRPIDIKEGAWIAARTTVGPGVTVGEGAVLGLGGVANHDLEPWTIYIGVPATPIRTRVIAAAGADR
jgi:putative colanic acid biosynthesis acetyltransferase WcaF